MATKQVNGLATKTKFFRGLGDASRLAILESLRDQPRTVGDIVSQTGLSQSNVSNHLGCLRECGLVTAERNGWYVTYMLSDDRVAELLSAAEELLSDVAKGVYECTRYGAPQQAGKKAQYSAARYTARGLGTAIGDKD